MKLAGAATMKMSKCLDAVHSSSGCVCVCSYPEVDAHGGDEAPGQKGSVFEADQQTGLPNTRIPDQHHLRRAHTRRAGEQAQ